MTNIADKLNVPELLIIYVENHRSMRFLSGPSGGERPSMIGVFKPVIQVRVFVYVVYIAKISHCLGSRKSSDL